MSSESARRRWSPALLLAAVALTVVCGDYDNPNAVIGGRKILLLRDAADPTWSPDGGIIVFSRLGHLYSVDYPDGRAEPLTSLTGLMAAPDFNPARDKHEVVFVHRPVGERQSILILNMDDFHFTEVFHDTVEIIDPCFSYDGEWIIFRVEEWNGLYRIKPEPDSQPSLIWNSTFWQDVGFHQASPHDGTILYVEKRLEDGVESTNLFRIAIDGTTPPVKLTGISGREDSPWRLTAAAESYDGLRTAVCGIDEARGPGPLLWLLPSAGPEDGVNALAQVTDRSDGEAGPPAWSPENDRLALALDGDLWLIVFE